MQPTAPGGRQPLDQADHKPAFRLQKALIVPVIITQPESW